MTGDSLSGLRRATVHLGPRPGESSLPNKTEQIFFPQRTPGVFLFRPKDEHFAVSFEDKGDTYYLTFGPNPKYGGQYMLLATEWDRKTGKVTYAGKKFYTSSAEIPRLLVNLKRESRNTTEGRTAGGRTIKQ